MFDSFDSAFWLFLALGWGFALITILMSWWRVDHGLAEVLVELLGVVGYQKIVALLGRGRNDMHVTISHEDGAGDLSIDLTVERDFALAKREGRRIAAQFEILYLNRFPTRQQSAQLLVIGIGVPRMLGVNHGTARR